MLPWIHLDTADLGDGQSLRLKRRGAEFSIMLGSIELMNSRLSGSEEALARLTLARLTHRDGPRILIGGLGMGFTLRAALKEAGTQAHVTVAELVPQVLDWARGPMADLFAGSLVDPRVKTHQGDVADCIKAGGWDAIMLDVDNGPEGLTVKSNDGLYAARGLAAALDALTPNGILSVWSSAPDPSFTRRLAQAGFEVTEMPTRASTKKRGARHMIWLAQKPNRPGRR